MELIAEVGVRSVGSSSGKQVLKVPGSKPS